MLNSPVRSPTAMVGLGLAALLIAGCGSSRHIPAKRTLAPARTIPGPAGLLAAGPPQPNGTIWTLSGHGDVRTLNAINLSLGREQTAVGATASATAITQSAEGQLAVGDGSATTGAVELLNGSDASSEAVIPVSAPVRAVAFGANGSTLYALDSTPHSASISVIDTSTRRVVKRVPVPAGSTSLVPSADQQAVWTVQRSGGVQETSLRDGRVMTAFGLGDPAISVALSPTGDELFVLKGTASSANIAVIKVATETVQEVLPAAAHSVGLQLSLNGSQLYDVVGSRNVGNIQVIAP